MTDEIPVHNPAEVEARIEQLANRLARGVTVVSGAEKAAREARRLFDRAYAAAYLNADGEPAHARRYAADVATMTERETAELAELQYKHAARLADALERELSAWQSISSSVRAMYGATRA